MTQLLAGRSITVIGAGTQPSRDPDAPVGNGRAIAVRAAREGASVICVDRNEAAVEETWRLITEEGGKAAVVVADVTTEEGCRLAISDDVISWSLRQSIFRNSGRFTIIVMMPCDSSND